MTTCKSPRKVICWAHRLATRFLPQYSSKFSRHDFTLPQLFACLVLREHQKKSYRGVEALLEDSAQWRADIGLASTPDHNTLCHAFHDLTQRCLIDKMLDQTARWAEQRKLIKGRVKPIALDSSMFESRHVSRHFEKRQRQTARRKRKIAAEIRKSWRATVADPASSARCPSLRWRWRPIATSYLPYAQRPARELMRGSLNRCCSMRGAGQT